MATETLLCPTDFSPISGNALRYANELAFWMGARLVLFHNIPKPTQTTLKSPGETPGGEPIRDPEYLLDQLQAWQQQLASGGQPIPYATKLGYGLTQESIAAEASARGADLVVLARKTGSKIKQIMRGSVIGDVIRLSPCPVLIVPPEADFKPLSHLVLASKDLDQDDFDLTLLKRLALLFRSWILVLHILEEDTAEERQQAQAAFARFSQKLPGIDLSLYLEARNDIEDAINQFSFQHQADLLVMGCQQQYLWESFVLGDHIKRMAYHASLPLLVIPF